MIFPAIGEVHVEAESGFGSEIQRRRRAIELVDQGVAKAVVADRVGRSRWWVDKWVKRFRAHGDAGLVDRPRTPLRQPTKTTPAVVAEILEVRDRLDADPVASVGALTILAEMERDGFTPIPSTATIERILRHNDRTRARTKRQRTGIRLPLPVVTTPGVWQQADWVQDRWLTGGIRYNSLQIGDVGSHGVAAGQYLDRRLLTAVTFLIERAWPTLSIPSAMGTDNAFSSTTHPNNPFTIWVKACLYFGVEVIIGPPGGLGWTNHVESVNNLWQDRTIWVDHFDSLTALRQGSNRAVGWLNTRRPILAPDLCGTRYPSDYIRANQHQLRWPPTYTIDDHLDQRGNLAIPLAAGRITFIRHITEHHTITVAGVDWPVPDSTPIGGLVTATITTNNHRLEIRRQGEPVKQFDYPIKHPIVAPYYPPTPQSLIHHV